MASQQVHLDKNVKGFYRGTKTEIEALSDIPTPSIGFGWTTDPSDGEFGVYNGTSWEWGSGGGGLDINSLTPKTTLVNDDEFVLADSEASYGLKKITWGDEKVDLLSLGQDLIQNGSFTGNANGWTLDAGWAYNSNRIEHTPGTVDTAYQSGMLVPGIMYLVELEVGGTAGQVVVALDDGNSLTISAPFTGNYWFSGKWEQDLGAKILVEANSAFDGYVDGIVVRELPFIQDVFTEEISDNLPYVRKGGTWVPLSDELPSTTEAFPVGSVFLSVVSTNPSTLLGYGTWSSFGAGRVLVGLDAGQTEFDTVEETGGAKTHTLTSSEMPSHTHTQNAHTHTQDAHTHSQATHSHIGGFAGVNAGASYGVTTAPTGNINSQGGSSTANHPITSSSGATIANATATNQNTTPTNQNTGGGGAHNNLQPYIVVYMWKRIS